MAKRYKSTFDQQMQRIAKEYREEHGEEMDINAMFDWAVSTGRYQPRRNDIRKQFKREMSGALGREMKIDAQGREVRANHAYKEQDDEGQWHWEWAPIETIRPKHMHMSLTHRRDMMVATAVQHKMDWSSYNDNNVHGSQLPLFDYNLNLDIEEHDQPEDWPEEDPDQGLD